MQTKTGVAVGCTTLQTPICTIRHDDGDPAGWFGMRVWTWPWAIESLDSLFLVGFLSWTGLCYWASWGAGEGGESEEVSRHGPSV